MDTLPDTMPVDPFLFDPPTSLLRRAALNAARPLLSRLTGLGTLRDLLQRLPDGPDETFVDRALEILDVEIDVHPGELAKVPADGPVIIAANHPRGALDGLVMAAVLRRVRPDGRLLANYLLSRIPQLRSSCFFVDPFEGPTADARSMAGLRAAHVWLKRGGALIMFPAGAVADRRNGAGVPVEAEWHTGLERLAASTGAAIVPAFIDGANSDAFYIAGRLHPALRTLMLPRELLQARGGHVTIRVGTPLVLDAGAGTASLAREAVERLSQATPTKATTLEPVPSMASEIERLGPETRLVSSGTFDVFCAAASQIPLTLQEIGRLRAVTYRAAGEGTTAAIDIDRFDSDYQHLFVWDHDEQCVVGAYRLGRTDQLLQRHGVGALYTRTLFNYGPDLIAALSPALELGRSFVRPEYQRNYQPLLLLWRGIGQFIVRHPEYRVLFGPVSISASYSERSHALLQAFLERNHLDASLARLISPVAPRPSVPLGQPVPAGIADADRAIASVEPDGKGMPVLLRQYLRLNAHAIGFSVDHAFGHVLDALMAVDLTSVNPTALRRYLGAEGLESWSAAQGRPRLSTETAETHAA